MTAQRPLRILSLDGGGVRGIATLILLREIMAQIPRELEQPSKKGELLRPCEYFDLICGTSTGGLIAVMLGRLRYSVQEAIDLYLSLSETLFTSTSKDIDAAFDHNVLEAEMKNVIAQAPANLDRDAAYADPDLVDWKKSMSPNGCRTFVVAMQTRGTGDNATLLRTYGTRLDSASPGRIWEVCRATSAAPTFFRPIEIDHIKYGDGGLIANNPTRLAIREVREMWPHRTIGCLLSLGTGEVAANQLVESNNIATSWSGRIFASLAPKPKFQLEVAKWCVKNTTRCAKVHHEVMENLDQGGLRNSYFRLNTPDIGNIGLEEWKQMKDMIALTKDYMTPHTMRELKSTIARAILGLPSSSSNSKSLDARKDSTIAGGTNTLAQIEEGSARAPSAVQQENPTSWNVPVSSLLRLSRNLTIVMNLFQTQRTSSACLYRLWPKVLVLRTKYRQTIWEIVRIFVSPSHVGQFHDLCSLEGYEELSGNILVTGAKKPAQMRELHNILFRGEADLRELEGLCYLMTSSQTFTNLDNKTHMSLLERSLDNLQTTHQNMKALKEKIKNIEESSPTSTTRRIKGPARSSGGTDQRLKLIEATSTSLFQALQSSCAQHKEHIVHLRLQPHHAYRLGDKMYIEYKLRYGHKQGVSAEPSDEPSEVFWLAIRSAAPGQHRGERGVKRSIGDESEIQQRRVRGGPHASGIPSFRAESLTSAPRCQDAQEQRPIDRSFCARGDFCMRIRRYDQATVEDTGMVLGFLVSIPADDHQVSFSDAYLSHGSLEPVSLTATLRAYFTGFNSGSMPHCRIGLAKQIASAMLQFQKTPFLRPTWSSDDVAFFGKPRDRFAAEASFRWPHLTVLIPENDAEEYCSVEEREQQRYGYQDITLRQALIGLATILVEIALQRPLIDILSSWHQYRTGDLPEDEVAFQRNTDDQARWEAVNLLCDGAAAHLGLQYRDVIRRCLDVSRDLEGGHSKAQSYDQSIYTDVVIALESIQKSMIESGE